MIARYFHILRNLPGILDRLERELGSKASKASLESLRYTVGRKVDTKDHVLVSEIIHERFAERPTHADIVLVKEEIGVRIDDLANDLATEVIDRAQGDRDLGAEIDTLAFNSTLAAFDAEVAATKAEIEALDAVKTGEPNLFVGIDMAAGDGVTSMVAFNQHVDDNGQVYREAVGEPIITRIPPTDDQALISHPAKKARKPRAPKGGAK